MRNGNRLVLHNSYVDRLGNGSGIVGRNLISEKIKIHPGVSATSFLATEDAAIELECRLKVDYEEREMKWRDGS